MANRGGGRGGAENRGGGNQGRGNNGNNFRVGYQGDGGAPGFNNFHAGGPSGAAGGQGGQQGQFMSGVGQQFNGFQGGGQFQGVGPFQGGGFPGPNFQGGGYGGFQGNNGFPGNNGFMVNNGYQGNFGFQNTGFQGENLDFNAGFGFNDYSNRGGFRSRRGSGDGYRGRGRGRGQNNSGRGMVSAGNVARNDDEQLNATETRWNGQGQNVTPNVVNQSAAQLAAKAQDLAVTQAAIAAKAAITEAQKNDNSAAVGAEGSDPSGLADLPTKKGKKTDKLRCYRCKVDGHFVEDCPKPFCDIRESIEHISENCPMLSVPKPQILMYGLADEQLMFFELPLSGAFKPKSVSSKLGMLSVTKGTLSIAQIVEQLKRLVPNENFQWVVNQTSNNVFKVMFPSKAELERLKVFGTFKVPNSLSEMTFASWDDSIKPLYLLPGVWVRVTGLPDTAKTIFLALWTLGFLFGKTLRVDMPYMRKHVVLRILIGCMDYTRIPQGKNLFVQDGFYDLTFEVEGLPVVVEDLVMADVNDGSGQDDDHDPDGGRGGLVEVPDNAGSDREGKRTKSVNDTRSVADAAEASEVKDDNVSKKGLVAGVVFSPTVLRQMDEARAKMRTLCSQARAFSELDAAQVQVQCSPTKDGQVHATAGTEQIVERDDGNYANGCVSQPAMLDDSNQVICESEAHRDVTHDKGGPTEQHVKLPEGLGSVTPSSAEPIPDQRRPTSVLSPGCMSAGSGARVSTPMAIYLGQ
ncbi:hypothetical protein ACQ4PT_027373 [Festuca glaucescens]